MRKEDLTLEMKLASDIDYIEDEDLKKFYKEKIDRISKELEERKKLEYNPEIYQAIPFSNISNYNFKVSIVFLRFLDSPNF